MRKLIFLDIETTGLDAELDEPWEVAWIQRDLERGRDTEYSVLVEHNTERAAGLPPKFKADYDARWDPGNALSRAALANLLQSAFWVGKGSPKPTLIGAIPSFDTTRLVPHLKREGITEPWHYQIKCVESVALGYLQGRLASGLSPGRAEDIRRVISGLVAEGNPLKSDELSRVLGVDPAGYDRHTSLGDCRWVRDMWDVMFGMHTVGYPIPRATRGAR